MSENNQSRVRHYRGPEDAADYVVRGLLFLSSYAILFALIAMQLWCSVAAVVFLGFALLGAVALVVLLMQVANGSPDPFQIREIDDSGADVSGYVVGYLLPLLIQPEPTGRMLASYVVFILVVAVIYIRSNLVQINPLLYLFSYRVFSIVTGSGRRAFLVSRHPPSPGSTVLATHLTSRLLVRTRSDDQHESDV